MNALFTVEKCPDRRNVKHNDYDDSDDDIEDLFNTISFQPKRPQVQARASGGQTPKTWEHYIAVEEDTWDYAPHLKPADR